MNIPGQLPIILVCVMRYITSVAAAKSSRSRRLLCCTARVFISGVYNIARLPFVLMDLDNFLYIASARFFFFEIRERFYTVNAALKRLSYFSRAFCFVRSFCMAGEKLSLIKFIISGISSWSCASSTVMKLGLRLLSDSIIKRIS